jgi:putative membrane protein insertion efficiency factor
VRYFVKSILFGLISFYRAAISPYLGGHCRFRPSCSEYTRTALEVHGIIKGLWLGIRRLLKCHPYSSKGGWDPVPPAEPEK